MDRIAMLNEILAQNPNDAFARYGLAMEFSNSGDVSSALQEFHKLLAAHPDYTAGYFMAAQALAKSNRAEEAKRMLSDGIVPLREPAMLTRDLKWKQCWLNLSSSLRRLCHS